MLVLKSLAALALTVGTIVVATAPCEAAAITFAQYSAMGTTSNIRWTNNGSTNSNGTGGHFYSVAGNATTSVAATTDVSFSFLQPAMSPYVTNVVAAFKLDATAPSGNPAFLGGSFLIQPGISGNFSFLTTTAITIGSVTHAAGSNLLSGTFTNAAIAGNRSGSSGGLSASSSPTTLITYSSDFLTFDNSAVFDFSLSLTSILSVVEAAPIGGSPAYAMRSFRGLSGGGFSSDPAPTAEVPEPAVWGMMIVGFGMVGVQSRRRVRRATLA